VWRAARKPQRAGLALYAVLVSPILALLASRAALAHMGGHGGAAFAQEGAHEGGNWLFEPLDIYCERMEPGFWAEPLNALSNAGFLVAALAVFVLLLRQWEPDRPVAFLAFVLGLIGVGSFLFHTFANGWSLLADVIPIAIFIYGFFILAMRRFVGLGPWMTAAATVAFFLFSGGMSRLLPEGFLNGSGSYLPAFVLLAGTGGYLLLRRHGAARGLLLAAAVFAVSLSFRSSDMSVCEALPVGLHYMWHMLNAVVLFICLWTAMHNRRAVE